jgi:CheY-like chemotaxis protein/signal transduction histidine kinase
LSLFLNWEKNNQIGAAVYFLILFTLPGFFLNSSQLANEKMTLLVPSTICILVISIVAVSRRNSTFINRSGKKADNEAQNFQQLENVGNEFFANSLVPLFRCNIKGDFDYINLSFRDTFFFGEDNEISQLNLFENIVKNDKVKKHFLKKIENKGKVEGYRFKYENKNGNEEVYLLDCRSKVEDENIFIEGSIRNITKQYKSDKALRNEIENLKQAKRQKNKIVPNITDSNPKKSNVLSRMGHELRTPMNSVLGFLTLIENGLFENEDELKEFSHSAKLSAESLLGLINDVVEIAKIQDNTVDIEKTEFNLREKVEQIVTDLQPHLQQKELSLDVEIDDTLPEIIVSDQLKYSQVLLNLLRNAIHVSENSNINLSIETQTTSGNKLNLITTIEDSGEVIDESELEKLISDDFGQGENNCKITSSVLHIMICKELINLLEGKISATSEIGKGNRFIFEIEIESGKVETESQEDESKNFGANLKSKAKLLLVEDNPISRKVEQKLLQEAGYDVYSVESAKEALDLVNEKSYDLILMDIELKDMNVLEATKLIRELPNNKANIPIIAVTAHSSMKDREKCLIAGMNDYISKPINITFLKMTIDQWVSASKAK